MIQNMMTHPADLLLMVLTHNIMIPFFSRGC